MSDTIHTDTLNVIDARAARLDVRKMQITATVRLARPGLEAETHTRGARGQDRPSRYTEVRS